MPVFTFLEEYDFSGKVILPLSSNGGTRFGDSISDLSKEAPNSYVGQGFEYFYSGGSELEGELLDWLNDRGIDITHVDDRKACAHPTRKSGDKHRQAGV